MQTKMYRMRGVTVENGKRDVLNLNLEFEGERAFVVLDTLPLGALELKTRLEIDPDLLQKGSGRDWDFLYRGNLVLPQPRNN
jgi:hypothetical protein